MKIIKKGGTKRTAEQLLMRKRRQREKRTRIITFVCCVELSPVVEAEASSSFEEMIRFVGYTIRPNVLLWGFNSLKGHSHWYDDGVVAHTVLNERLIIDLYSSTRPRSRPCRDCLSLCIIEKARPNTLSLIMKCGG